MQTTIICHFEDIVDLDHLRSEEAIWSDSGLHRFSQKAGGSVGLIRIRQLGQVHVGIWNINQFIQ